MRNIGKALAVISVVAFAAASNRPALADQGGVSFWLPGAFGSLAASPLVPGWSLGAIYLRSDVNAGGDVAASRAIAFPNRTVNLTASLDAQLHGRDGFGHQLLCFGEILSRRL